MLTIKNPRRDVHHDTGIVIGSFKLVDGGLCNKEGGVSNGSSIDCDSYSFYWNYNNESRRFKCFLEREPIEGTTSIYNFEIYDEGAKIQGKIGVNGKAGLIYATSVGTHTHLKDRIGFYTWMTNQIVKFMGVC
jgi:hypothetical protein